MRKVKEGVSLIVLVLTIVIMIILGGVIILNLSNSNMIDKSSETVKDTNLDTVQELASIGWAISYGKGARTKVDLEAGVTDYITSSGVTEAELNDYVIDVTTTGVSVSLKSTTTPTVTE